MKIHPLFLRGALLFACASMPHLSPAYASGIPGGVMLVIYAPELIDACIMRKGGSVELQMEFASWLARQAPEIREIAGKAEVARKDAAGNIELMEHRDRLRELPLDELSEQCVSLSDYFRGVSPRADPRREDITTTWNSFVAAMRAGNAKEARQFLSGSALENFRRAFGATDPQKMIAWANKIAKFSISTASGEMQEAAVSTQSGYVFFITFWKQGKNWSIVSM